MVVDRIDGAPVHQVRIFTVSDDWLECRAGVVDVDVFNCRSGILTGASCHEQHYQKETG